MKESTGELNMTVVTVVAIAAIVAFFYMVVWPGMKENIERNQHCATAICPSTCTGKVCSCTYLDASNNEQPVSCQAKG